MEAMLTDDSVLREKPRAPTRRNDPERTKGDILAVATKEFADHGLSGARVDAIAARTRTTKRAIYYYFGSKEALYIAVLEKAYGDIRSVQGNRVKPIKSFLRTAVALWVMFARRSVLLSKSRLKNRST
jgi:AcrR family transcriptional regulator